MSRFAHAAHHHLTTDFGTGSPYVAAMKGVILSINPEARMVDLTHSIRRTECAPGGSGAGRQAPMVSAGDDPCGGGRSGRGDDAADRLCPNRHARFHGPGQWLAQPFGAADAAVSTIITVTTAEYWLPRVSATFHGRDIWRRWPPGSSLGLDPSGSGPAGGTGVMLDWPEVRVSGRKIEGSVSNRSTRSATWSPTSRPTHLEARRGEDSCDRLRRARNPRHFRTYADQPEMTLIALVGSSGKLELAIVGDSAAIMLGVRVGTPVTVTW